MRSRAAGARRSRVAARKKAASTLREMADAIRRAPDDVEAHVRLDYQLASERRFDEVIAMWDRFIATHPKEARAYQERGGAHFNSGRREQALADIDKACALGSAAGCQIASRIRAR